MIAYVAGMVIFAALGWMWTDGDEKIAVVTVGALLWPIVLIAGSVAWLLQRR